MAADRQAGPRRQPEPSAPGLASPVLVTGATGYVGGRLVPHLLALGYRVRVLARDPQRLRGRAWRDRVQIFQGDALDQETLGPALAGVAVAYYLIHSMAQGEAFHQADQLAARNFGRAARRAGVDRIIYLGGLGDPETSLSEHLRSRQATGQSLRESGVAVTEFRAGIVVGAGSVSFEMIRYLTERIPVMVAPRWVRTRTQPIAIDDLLEYLAGALSNPESVGQTIELGGDEVLTYGDMMLGYARVRGLRRIIVPVPVLTPRLSSYWVHWMTPISAQIARPLIEGLKTEVVVRDDLARRLFPDVEPIPYAEAVERALDRLRADQVETAWSDALASSPRQGTRSEFEIHQGMFLERRQRSVQAPPSVVFAVVSDLGGERGWLYANWLWRLRGVIDRALGGVGSDRGRRSHRDLRPGDAIDFWRVESIEPDSYLRLRAELRLPGESWFEFTVAPAGDAGDSSIVSQTAYFAPKGLAGFLVWYLLYPFHSSIFSGMIRRIGELAESRRTSNAS